MTTQESLEIIENPNGTFAIYRGNVLLSDRWKTRAEAEQWLKAFPRTSPIVPCTMFEPTENQTKS